MALDAGPDRPPFLMWRLCDALRAKWALRDAGVAQQDAQARQAAAERALGDPGLGRIAGLTLECFNPDLLRVQLGHDNPHTLICDWIAAIADRPEGDYHRGPPVALYLYWPGKGTGKTHLAAGATLALRAAGRLAVFVEESSYLSALWSAPMEGSERLYQLPGDLAHITAIDDIGRLPPGKGPGNGTEKAWYNVINRRWLRRRWTIFTSNRTLDELLAQCTIDDATYSRMAQMMGGADRLVLVEGDDQRLRRS